LTFLAPSILIINVLEAHHVFSAGFYFLHSATSTFLDFDASTSVPIPLVFIALENGDLVDPRSPRVIRSFARMGAAVRDARRFFFVTPVCLAAVVAAVRRVPFPRGKFYIILLRTLCLITAAALARRFTLALTAVCGG